MSYLTAVHTDVGTRKKTNQDSMLVMQASSSQGDVLFASVCDGMGGLAKGELASATMIRALSAWFTDSLPGMLERGFDAQTLYGEWGDLIESTNRSLSQYAEDHHTNLGTTAVGLLMIGTAYYLFNVGDSRIYRISDNVYQLTKDQTYVQREMDAGRMTYEQSLMDPNRSMLLQCIGATADVHPVFDAGMTVPGEVFMLCSDGFRHVVMPQEFYQAFYPPYMTSREIMEQRMKEITALNISRNEDDNISAMLIKVL